MKSYKNSKIKDYKKIQGFSLIELMVVIAIVGILAAVAVPSYRSYIMKSHFIQAVTLIQNCKKEIQMKYDETGSFPSSVCGVSKADRVVVDIGEVDELHYNYSSSRAWFAAKFKNSLVPTTSRIHIGIMPHPTNSTMYLSSCGRWDLNNLSDEYFEYLPAGCDDPAVGTTVN